jgi:uncharacterized OsmC-like protein
MSAVEEIMASRGNGVDVETLGQTLEAIRQLPSLGQFQFRARNRWMGGSRNRTTVKDFYGAGGEDTTRKRGFEFDADEPAVLVGSDTGANPVEYLLADLAGCMTTAMVYHAASRGIEIGSVESSYAGDLDVRGFTGLSEDVPKGYQRIAVTFRVQTEGDPAELEGFARMSPVYNSVCGSVPIEIKVETA